MHPNRHAPDVSPVAAGRARSPVGASAPARPHAGTNPGGGFSTFGPLFDRPAPHNGTRTSRAAARQVRDRAPSLRVQILSYLRVRVEGATREDIAKGLGIRLDTVNARVHELGESGHVRALAATGVSGAGRAALVFVAAENVNGRALEAWPAARTDWKSRALAAEARLAQMGMGGEVRPEVSP